MKTSFLAAAMVLGVVCSQATVKASPLNAGAIVAGTNFSTPFVSNTGTFTGTLTFAIWRETGSNYLDFLYQINPNNPSSAHDITHLSMFKFNNPLVNVTMDSGDNLGQGGALGAAGFNTSVGIAPTAATQTNSVIDYTFPLGSIFGSIAPGTHSQILVIRTDATLYDTVTGNTSVTDGGTADIHTYSPVHDFNPPDPTPEPGTLALLGIGGVCMLGYGWRRRKVVVRS